jgi:long-chain acyl-CoA synthetase
VTEDNKIQILARLPERISSSVYSWAKAAPNHPALVESDATWTYGQLAEVLCETRDWLKDVGIRPGDRVMLVCENCRAFVALLLALTEVDAWPVLVNAHLSAREVDAILEHSGARRVIYTTSASSHAQEHAARHGAQTVQAGTLGEISVSALDENTEPEPIEGPEAERVAALIYTSGTTGQPKGVMLTHSNLLYIAAVSAKIRSLTPDDRLYGVLPMSHAVGLSVVLLGTLLSGATLYLTSRFDPMTARTTLEKDRITILLGVPSMFRQFLQYAALRKLDALKFPALRIISSSGAPLDMPTKQATEKLFGMPLHNGYGITECSPTIAQTRVETPLSTISVGQLLPGVQARFVGPDQKEVPAGEIGELHVRGPIIMKGYYRAPEATAAAVDSDGWFNTRDLAKLEEGNLFVVGRTKDLIVRSGFNVYPVEVEAVLNAHAAVARSAVIGRSVQGDEEVLAFVQPVPESNVTITELAEHAARHLASYKRPSKIFLVDSMPLTPTGKVAKNELAKMLPANERELVVSR